MGLQGAPDAAIGALFHSIDVDGSGSVSYKELHELLSRSEHDAPALPMLPLDAKNPTALRKQALSKRDANLLQGCDLGAAA
eukprot:6723009-Prymnesium_polylepis.1